MEQHKVVIIDDSDVTLMWTQEALEKAGLRVVTHDKAQGAGAMVVREQPDLVLLDVNMPTLGGEDLVDVIRGSERSKDTCVVLYSSMPIRELREAARRCGADGCVAKGADAESFARQVRLWARRGRVMAQARGVAHS